ncbi:MAG: S1C family serine protease [Streptosporangiaceae bacterium]
MEVGEVSHAGRGHAPRSSLAVFGALIGLAGLLAGCTSGGSSAAPKSSASSAAATTPPSATGVALQHKYESVVRKVLPSVVQIKAGNALGSGIIYDKKGDIVTNAHVVGNNRHFTVRLATGGKELQASLVGTYTPADLAVIHAEGAQHPRPAHFTDSGRLRVGQIVLAMGNPLGLQGSVTEGIISALGRTVNEPQGGHSPGAVLPNAIQTSASINPGNSGGALVDLSGDVVAIPTLAATDPELGGQAPGIGFAIPSNTVTNVADQLIEQGKVTRTNRAALNVRVQTVVSAAGEPVGVGIVRVSPGGAADEAGLESGDVITSVAGHKTPNTQVLQDVLAKHDPGDTVQVTVTKPDGSQDTVKVTLGQLTTG